MEPIRPGEVMSREAYELARSELRRRILVLKGKRRVPLGDHATLHFETRATMLYQVHEMLRAEGSWERPGAVEEELAAYNPLIPAGRELSATLMLEYEGEEERAAQLSRLVGIDRHVWLEIGEEPRVPATFEPPQLSSTRVSAIQYVRWPLSERQAELVRSPGTVVRVVVDHPSYQAQAVLSEETREELGRDLGAEASAYVSSR